MQYELGVKPIRFWAYDKRGKFVCRVELNSAGVAVFSGVKGKRRIADMGWETLCANLNDEEPLAINHEN